MKNCSDSIALQSICHSQEADEHPSLPEAEASCSSTASDLLTNEERGVQTLYNLEDRAQREAISEETAPDASLFPTSDVTINLNILDDPLSRESSRDSSALVERPGYSSNSTMIRKVTFDDHLPTVSSTQASISPLSVSQQWGKFGDEVESALSGYKSDFDDTKGGRRIFRHLRKYLCVVSLACCALLVGLLIFQVVPRWIIQFQVNRAMLTIRELRLTKPQNESIEINLGATLRFLLPAVATILPFQATLYYQPSERSFQIAEAFLPQNNAFRRKLEKRVPLWRSLRAAETTDAPTYRESSNWTSFAEIDMPLIKASKKQVQLNSTVLLSIIDSEAFDRAIEQALREKKVQWRLLTQLDIRWMGMTYHAFKKQITQSYSFPSFLNHELSVLDLELKHYVEMYDISRTNALSEDEFALQRTTGSSPVEPRDAQGISLRSVKLTYNNLTGTVEARIDILWIVELPGSTTQIMPVIDPLGIVTFDQFSDDQPLMTFVTLHELIVQPGSSVVSLTGQPFVFPQETPAERDERLVHIVVDMFLKLMNHQTVKSTLKGKKCSNSVYDAAVQAIIFNFDLGHLPQRFVDQVDFHNVVLRPTDDGALHVEGYVSLRFLNPLENSLLHIQSVALSGKVSYHLDAQQAVDEQQKAPLIQDTILSDIQISFHQVSKTLQVDDEAHEHLPSFIGSVIHVKPQHIKLAFRADVDIANDVGILNQFIDFCLQKDKILHLLLENLRLDLRASAMPFETPIVLSDVALPDRDLPMGHQSIILLDNFDAIKLVSLSLGAAPFAGSEALFVYVTLEVPPFPATFELEAIAFNMFFRGFFLTQLEALKPCIFSPEPGVLELGGALSDVDFRTLMLAGSLISSNSPEVVVQLIEIKAAAFPPALQNAFIGLEKTITLSRT